MVCMVMDIEITGISNGRERSQSDHSTKSGLIPFLQNVVRRSQSFPVMNVKRLPVPGTVPLSPPAKGSKLLSSLVRQGSWNASFRKPHPILVSEPLIPDKKVSPCEETCYERFRTCILSLSDNNIIETSRLSDINQRDHDALCAAAIVLMHIPDLHRQRMHYLMTTGTSQHPRETGRRKLVRANAVMIRIKRSIVLKELLHLFTQCIDDDLHYHSSLQVELLKEVIMEQDNIAIHLSQVQECRTSLDKCFHQTTDLESSEL